MKRIIYRICVPVLLLISMTNVNDQLMPSKLEVSEALNDTTNNQNIDAEIIDEMINQNVPGVAIGIIKNGKITYTKGYGFTDLEKKTKVTSKTIFRWASISKVITAVAAFQVEDRYSNYSIKDNITEHVNYWTNSKTNNKSKITLEHLLSHRSGINHYGKGRNNKRQKKYNYTERNYKTDTNGFNAQKSVDVFKNAPLDFKPGDFHRYSSFAYNLLGASIEEVTPKGYVDWVQKHIAKKAGMNSLQVSNTSRRGYKKNRDGNLRSRTIGSMEVRLPSGGWESNITDLTKFTAGLINDEFLPDTSVLWSEAFDNNKSYSMGVRTRGSGNNLRVFHGGSHDNIKTSMHFFPNRKTGVVIMAWSDHANASRFINRVYDALGESLPWSVAKNVVDKCVGAMDGNEKEKLAAIWIKSNQDVIIRRGYSTKEFNTERNFLASQGYQIDNLEANSGGKNPNWDGIFKKSNNRIKMWRNFSQDAFYKKWREESQNGYLLFDLETYIVNGQRKWAGLFKKMKGKQAMFRNFDSKSFGDKRNELSKQGYKLVDVEPYNVNGKLRWAGVWLEGDGELLNRNYSRTDFYNLRKKRANAGYKLVDIEIYNIKGKEKWAGIWEKIPAGSGFKYDIKYCDLMDFHHEYSNKGYELIDLEKF